MNKYLLEIGLEEMPANVILPAVEQLMILIKQTCEKHQLSYETIQTFSTPRRLAVLVTGLPEKQADRYIELKGPPVELARDVQNKWTKSAEGFAKKNGIKLADLEFRDFGGKDYLFYKKKELGFTVRVIFESYIGEWISKINFPKNMRWGSYKMRFIRPIRWIVSLWNNSLVPVKLEMVEAGNQTKGHRFLSPGKTAIKQAGDFQNQLEKLFVMADFEKRRESIVSQVKNLELQSSFKVELDHELLEEVTNLVEWPTVILGDFDKEFLELPSEVLVTSMAVNQRFFPVFKKNKNKNSKNRELLPNFVTVRNGNKKNINIVKRGNEKVLSARLSDARFFYKEDQKKSLEEFCFKLNKVVFFQELGTQNQRVKRIANLSQFIGKKLNFSIGQIKIAKRIAELSKFDLVTQMVQEFPELQGVMGENYASLKNEDTVVCRGIREHYYPRNAKDSCPRDKETVTVALADKLDLLVSAFSLNMIPSGATDPYALRRSAQSVIQIILILGLSLNLEELISKAIQILDDQLEKNIERSKLKSVLIFFFIKRQRWFLQQKGIRYDLIEAVLQIKSKEKILRQNKTSKALPIEQLKFAELISKNLPKKIFKRSVEAIVRAENICKKYPQKIPKKIKESTLLLSEEKSFFKVLEPIINSDKKALWSPENYLEQLYLVEPLVTSFFDNVLIMDDDPLKCGNRLWMCNVLADWSGRHLDLKSIILNKTFAKNSL